MPELSLLHPYRLRSAEKMMLDFLCHMPIAQGLQRRCRHILPEIISMMSIVFNDVVRLLATSRQHAPVLCCKAVYRA